MILSSSDGDNLRRINFTRKIGTHETATIMPTFQRKSPSISAVFK